MFNQTFPTSPFIYFYDDKYEIQEREWRIKRKVKELQKNGDFSRPFKRPHIEASAKRHRHDMKKSHSSRRSSRRSQADRAAPREPHGCGEGKKLCSADRHREADRDFPRGAKAQSSGSVKAQKPSKSFHRSAHYHKLREEKLAREGKRSKEKKKERHVEDDDNDNLFLIKQRKKKSKL